MLKRNVTISVIMDGSGKFDIYQGVAPALGILGERGSEIQDCNFQRDTGFCVAVWSRRRTRSLVVPVRVPLRQFLGSFHFKAKVLL